MRFLGFNGAIFRRFASSTSRLTRMPEVVSKLEDFVARDNIHYFLAIGLIPTAMVVTYINVTRGPGVLTEIPDGYEPEVWEYFKSPITRLLSKYYFASEEQIHEIRLHAKYVKTMLYKKNLLEIKVKNLMKERQDYKAWYYTPSPSTEIFEKSEQMERTDHGHLAHVGDMFKPK